MSDPSTGMSRSVWEWVHQNILGLVAIFIALSGTAVATQVAQQERGPAAKAAKKVKRGPRGFPGPQGPQGLQGPQGPPGPATGSAGGDLTGSYPNPQIAPGAVGTAELGDFSITQSKFANTLPHVRVTNSTAESIADNTPTALTFDTEHYDFASMHDTSTNTSRLTATQGTASLAPYAITVSVRFAANATGIRSVTLMRNGTTSIASDSRLTVGAGAPTDVTLTAVVGLGDNSYVEAVVSQTSGAPLDVVKSSEVSPEFAMSILPGGSD